MKNILVIDGSLHGKNGNTGRLLEKFIVQLPETIRVDYLELCSCSDITAQQNRFNKADGFVFATGTYWQSWSSHAQRFFEHATAWEGTSLFLGKPVCTLVTMHSVGGMEVLSRAQSVFSLLGCMIPPMCSLAHSHMNQIAAEHSDHGDIWDETSFPAIIHNLSAALSGTHDYQALSLEPHDSLHDVWMK